jgi:hypothetical protein
MGLAMSVLQMAEESVMVDETQPGVLNRFA